MSVKTKKRIKNLGKICGALLFTLLMFTNIKVAMMDDADILKGDISLFGIEITLNNEIFALPWGEGCKIFNDCTGYGDYVCAAIFRPDGTVELCIYDLKSV